MKKIIIFNALLFVCAFAHSQNTITGTFPGLARQQINLIGFEGFDVYSIDSVKANEKGVFILSYGKKDFGMAYLSAEDDKPFFVVLNCETIQLKGDAFVFPETIEIIESYENLIFEHYATEHPRREQALSAWDYLEKIYASDSLFAVQKVPKQAIAYEKQRIKAEDSLFLASLNAEAYVSWYLPVRKLVSSVSTIAQYRTEEIPATIATFRGLDYTDKQFYKSGLLRDAIESHVWLIENSGRSLDSVYIEMKISIDCMIDNLIADEKKLNEITEYLFKGFEKRSLFGASEYLALKLLNEQSCTLNNDFAAQLESYRAMKKGNTAPDIVFSGNVLKSDSAINTINRLSNIQSAYKVVIFGASWCPKCTDELRQVLPLYEKWKAKDIEVVFISLDTDKALFKGFSSIFPFISMCDYKRWDTQSALDYYIFATPTMFLLDNNLKIILRPISVKQIDAWVDYAM